MRGRYGIGLTPGVRHELYQTGLFLCVVSPAVRRTLTYDSLKTAVVDVTRSVPLLYD